MPDTVVGAAWGDDDEPPRRPGSTFSFDDDFRDIPIEDLNLSMRAYNCLRRSGILTVGQIMERSPNDLLALRNFGSKSLGELWGRLHEVMAPPEEFGAS